MQAVKEKVGRAVLPARELLHPRTVARLGNRWLRARVSRGAYPELTERELLATRRSDTAFIFGLGRSLLEIGAEEWTRIGEHSTIGISEFVREPFVRVDYHVVGEVGDIDLYTRFARENPFYDETIFVLQRGWLAEDSNEIVARRLLSPGTRVFPYRRTSRGTYSPPSRSFSNGLVHAWNSSISVTNFAIASGFRRIVLTGIDLYDKEYFWLPPGERRVELKALEAPDRAFPMAGPIVDLFGRWRSQLEPEGVELLVYNPRSLLAEVLPVFAWAEFATR